MGILRTNTLSGLETPTPVTGSVSFDGSGDYLSVTANNDTILGNTWTVETWIFFNEVGGGSSRNSILQSGSGVNNSGCLGIYIETGPIIRVRANALGSDVDSSSGAIVSNVWHHITVSCSNNFARIFVDGVLRGSGNTNGSVTESVTRIGSLTAFSDYDLNGHISNLRVLKGIAKYTANFTPPTRELQPIGDTVLLCCNNSTSATAEATGKTITVNGNAVASTFSPGLVRDFTYGTQFSGVSRFDTQGYFVPPSGNTQNRYTLGLNEIVTSGLVLHLDAGNPFSYPVTGVGTKWTDLSGNNNHGTLDNGVGYSASNRGYLTFDGSNQRVLQSSATINFSGGSMEVWAYFNNFNGNQGVFAMNSDPTYINLYIPTSKLMRWEVIGSTANAFSSISSTYVLETNTWYHIVGTFGEGSTTKLYINGVLNNTLNSYTNIPSNLTSSIIVGQFAGYLNGRISNAKIYNRALTAAEVSQNYEALKGRYGLP